MGYDMNSIDGTLSIKRKNMEPAFDALKKANLAEETLKETLEYAGFYVDTYSKYDGLVLYSYAGKYSSVERLIPTIAPYMDDSEMWFQGEDGTIWRNVFCDGKVYEQKARISFDELTEDDLVG